MFACDGKVALLTGAFGVIGKVYTKHLLLNNIKGLALIDVQEPTTQYRQELTQKLGSNIVFIKSDVSVSSELKAAFDKTVQHFKQLDIVINNAGVSNEENYELCLQINFMAVMNGTVMAVREYLPKYKTGQGVVVNTASIAGVVPFSCSIYNVSKHAVASIGVCFTKNEDCLKHNIKVVTIGPGPTPSPILDTVAKRMKETGNFEEQGIPTSKDAEYLGKGLIKIMREGVNGAVWMFIEGKEPYQVDYSLIHKGALEYMMG